MATELEELRVLQISEQFSDEVWNLVGRWNEFVRDVVGKQITRSADSIGANIAESYGRFHYGEKINLLYYARGSTYETKYWLNRCRVRKLIDEKTAANFITRLTEIARQINSFAKILKSQRSETKPKTLRESGAEYLIPNENDAIFEPEGIEWLQSTDANLEPPLSVRIALSGIEFSQV